MLENVLTRLRNFHQFKLAFSRERDMYFSLQNFVTRGDCKKTCEKMLTAKQRKGNCITVTLKIDLLLWLIASAIAMIDHW